MQYKRHEYFRYEFDHQLEATLQVLLTDGSGESNPGTCNLLDISPGGTKVSTEFNLPETRGPLQLRLIFTLFEQPLTIEGEIAWKKPVSDGFQYGIDFIEDPSIEKLIVGELKLRRQREAEEKAGK
ncbi:PilZ domain-containing protein [Sporosarcina oncorhynchi]|uniref:PilZ domain-containing protein n=1 Tax=Sporosarcina oncorhynchi TaxID=3056444 RepID=A0ABZ0L8A2_9BACL|nr:PilZ domain-containing protein [Sporosarcina sp. T2O-4]WOV88394.1 PilZ domain-containing protein [Sporosarcina sp. T2O-4]